MDTIKTYLDSVFLAVQSTPEMQQLREELLLNMEDRYEELKAQGKSENEAIGTVIAEFGNIDELLEELNWRKEYHEETGQELPEITMGEALEFLDIRRKNGAYIGIGVMLILFGLGFTVLVTETFRSSFAEMLGLTGLFLAIAIAVGLFISAGMAMSRNNKQLDDRFISGKIKREIQSRKDAFQRSFTICLTIGIGLCILSVVPIFITDGLAAFTQGEFFEATGIGLMMFLIGTGVFLIIYGGVTMGSFSSMLNTDYFIADEDEVGPRAKKQREERKPAALLVVEAIYWPLVIILYLVWSFTAHNWGISWIIWPVAGIFYGMIESVIKALSRA